MKTCQNCSIQITCGCQERIASDGMRVCANCITSYEANLLLTQLQNNNINENVTS